MRLKLRLTTAPFVIVKTQVATKRLNVSTSAPFIFVFSLFHHRYAYSTSALFCTSRLPSAKYVKEEVAKTILMPGAGKYFDAPPSFTVAISITFRVACDNFIPYQAQRLAFTSHQ